MRRFRKVFLRSLLAIFFILLVLPISLYIPAVQHFACNQVVSFLNNDSTGTYHYDVEYVHLLFPLELKVGGFSMADVEGDTIISVGKLQTGLNGLSLFSQKMHVRRLQLDDVVLGLDNLVQNFGLSGEIHNLSVREIEIALAQESLSVGSVETDRASVNMCIYHGETSADDKESSSAWSIDVQHLSLVDTKVMLLLPDDEFYLYKTSDALRVDSLRVTTDTLTAKAQRVNIANASLNMDLNASQPLDSCFDYNHLRLTQLNFDVTDVFYSADSLTAHLNELSLFDTASDMRVDNITTRFAMCGSDLQASDIFLEMPETKLQGHASLDYSFFTAPYTGHFDITLVGRVSADEIIRQGSPYLSGLRSQWPNQPLTLDVDVEATAEESRINRFEIEIPKYLDISARGSVANLFDNKARSGKVWLKANVTHGNTLLKSALDNNEILSDIAMPDSMNLNLELSQQQQVFVGDVDILYNTKENVSSASNPVVTDFDVSTIANLPQHHLQISAMANTVTEIYDINADIANYDVSAFYKVLPLRHLTARCQMKGRYFDLLHSYAALDANVVVDSIAYDSLQLSQMTLNAQLDLARYTIALHSDNDLLKYDGAFEGLLKSDSLTAQGRFCLENMDFKLFDMFGGVGSISSCMTLNLLSDLNTNYNVSMQLDSNDYRRGTQHQKLADINATLRTSSQYLCTTLKGGDVSFSFQADAGTQKMLKLVDQLSQNIDNQVQSFTFKPSSILDSLPPLDFRLQMEQDNPFYPFIAYYGYGFGALSASASTRENFNTDISIIDYEDLSQRYDTLLFDLVEVDRETAQSYRYAMHAVYTDPVPRRSHTAHFEGRISDDYLSLDFDFVNGQQKKLYDISVDAHMANDSLMLHFTDFTPTIYALPFEINSDNFIRFTSFLHPEQHDLGITAFLHMHGPEDLSINLNTRPDTLAVGNKLELNIKQLDLGLLSRTVNWNKPTQGNVDCSLLADMKPDSLLGRLALSIDHFELGSYKADSLRLTGRMQYLRNLLAFGSRMYIDSTMVMQGAYQKSYHADSLASSIIQLRDFPLDIVNVFLPNDVNIHGGVRGLLRIDKETAEQAAKMSADYSETSSAPSAITDLWKGFLALDQASVDYDDAGVHLALANDTLTMLRNVLSFNNYTITAANANPLSLNGTVNLSRDIADPVIDLHLLGDNVLLFSQMQRPELKEQNIWGKLPIDINANLRGTASNLALTGKVSALTGTDISYYLAEDPLKADSKLNDLVEFVSFNKLNKKNTSLILSSGSQSFEGFSVNLGLDIARNASFFVQLPSDVNDKLEVQGGGSMQFTMLPNGNTVMNGSYEISGGNVTFKLPMLPMSKAFKISDGSTLRWSGETDNPELNLTATEEVRCTINDETGASRVVKFTVYVYIRNTVNDMSVSFSCAALEDATIQNQINSLTDEERSKQALQLLIAQTYTGPGVSSNSTMSSANAAINALIQKEMESFLNQRFKHTEISVGIDTYDVDGGGNSRTDYSLKISQRFFNDRVRIVLGGRVSSGNDVAMGNQDNASINDFSLEWLLKEDGSRYLKLFRKTNYESILEGEIVETGFGFVMQRSAYRFKDFFIYDSQKRYQQMLRKLRQMDNSNTGDSTAIGRDENQTERMNNLIKESGDE